MIVLDHLGHGTAHGSAKAPGLGSGELFDKSRNHAVSSSAAKVYAITIGQHLNTADRVALKLLLRGH